MENNKNVDLIKDIYEMDKNKFYIIFMDATGFSNDERIAVGKNLLNFFETKGVSVCIVPSETDGSFRIEAKEKEPSLNELKDKEKKKYGVKSLRESLIEAGGVVPMTYIKKFAESTLMSQTKEWLVDEILCNYKNREIDQDQMLHYAYMFEQALPYLTDKQFTDIIEKAHNRNKENYEKSDK